MNETSRTRACLAAVHDNKILLVPHDGADGDAVQWSIPGGEVKSSESQEDAARRGFAEETGLQARIDRLLDSGEDGAPEKPSSGITVTYLGSVMGGKLESDAEHHSNKNLPRWFSSQEVTTIETHPSEVVEQAIRRRGIGITGRDVPLESLMSPKDIVEQGYDRILERFIEWGDKVQSPEQLRQESALFEGLPAGAKVLELGCGAGLATTQRLAKRFDLTGVDISGRSLEMARRSCPDATFIHADMTKLDFPAASFDAVAEFGAIIHVPRHEHPKLLNDIASWLRPGGIFVGSRMANSTLGGVEEDWLGAPMFWSGFDSETNKQLVREAGLELTRAEVELVDEDGEDVPFLSIIARKPD